MLQCPNCHTETKAEERFCPNCGTRLEQRDQPPASPGIDISKPERSGSPAAGHPTIVLPADSDAAKTMLLPETPVPTTRLPQSEPSPTVRLPEPPSAPNRPPENQPRRPAVDATIVAGMPAPPPASSASDATFVGNPGQPAPSSEGPAFGLPSAPPTRPADDATFVGGPNPPNVLPPAASGRQVGAPLYSGTLPPGSVAAPQPAKAGGRLWKIVAIVAGLGVLACVALIAGVLMLVPTSTTTTQPTVAAAKTTQSTAAARPTAAPAPTAVAADSGTVLLRDNFDNPSRSGFDEGETENAIYKFTDGGYAITVKTPELILWNTVKGSYTDASIEVETTLDGPDKSAAGLIFRYQDDQNFYLFTVAGDGNYTLDLYKDDQLKTLIDWTESPAINGPGQLNRLRVETVGDTIRLFVNDELLDEISDDTFSGGKMALVANTFDEPNVTVTFDNLIVRDVK